MKTHEEDEFVGIGTDEDISKMRYCNLVKIRNYISKLQIENDNLEEIIDEKDKLLAAAIALLIKYGGYKNCSYNDILMILKEITAKMPGNEDKAIYSHFKQIMLNDNKKKELLNLIAKNPDLPFVFFVNNGEIDNDYGSTVFDTFTSYISEIYIFDGPYGEGEYSDDFDYVVEVYSDRFADDDKYKDLSDKEYEQAIEKYVNENVKHYKAIVVNVW